MEDRRVNGIPLHPTVVDLLRNYAAEIGVEFDLGM
jgi:hypothetical protein